MIGLEPQVYLAARSEDRGLALRIRAGLRDHAIGCTARWLELADLSHINDEQALLCLEDICRADVFVLVQSDVEHRDTTGGHHVETGYAIALAKPILLIGTPRNVFHGLRRVVVVNRAIDMGVLAQLVWQASGFAGPAFDRAVRR